MMISQKMADKLNEQVQKEFQSQWIYLAMAYRFETMGLRVFAKWFFKQAGEEQSHAMKIAEYLVDQGAEVKLAGLEKPKTDYKSAEEIASTAVAHEKQVTKWIHELVDLAKSENDHATFNFLQWFVNEQVEEVASTTELLSMVQMAGNIGQLFMLESRLYRMIESK